MWARIGWNFLDNREEGEALEYLFEISKSVGANLTVLKSDDISDSIIDYAEKNNISTIIIGKPPEKRNKSSVFSRLKKGLSKSELIIIPTD